MRFMQWATNHRKGQSLAEYGMIVIFIMLAVVGGLALLGNGVQQPVSNVSGTLTNALNSAGGTQNSQ